MSTSELRAGEAVRDVHFSDDTLSVDLVDGRTITVPLVWYPRLLQATPAQRENWEIVGAGYGIHWPDVDEDLSAEGLLRGSPAPHVTAVAK
jgi:Protein of unknown function (DUF2442)